MSSIKVSLCMATYNKNDLLSNTLYSIARQKTTFPFEVCIVDDHSDIDPEFVIRKFLPAAKYKRLEKKVGTQFAQSLCLSLVDSDSNVIVLQSCDVILAQSFILEHFYKKMESKKVLLAEVIDIPVSKDLYQNFDNKIITVLQKGKSNGKFYSGSQRPKMYFFLGAMLKNDLLQVGFDKICCDVVIYNRLIKIGYKPLFLDYLKGVHQSHPKTKHSCSILNTCPYYCYRKGKR